MDGGGELIGEIKIDPADALVLRRAIKLALRTIQPTKEEADLTRLYVQLGGDPENLK